MTTFNLIILSLFFIWRILFGPLSYPALVTYHYIVRAAVVSYTSLATGSRLVQLGLQVSFQRVVALREGRLLVVVVATCFTTTAAHLLLEAFIRHQRKVQHLGLQQQAVYVWFSKGQLDLPTENLHNTGPLLLPHLLVLILSYLTTAVNKIRDNFRTFLARYRLALVNNGANGRVHYSAFSILMVTMFFMTVFIPLFPRLISDWDKGGNDCLPFRCFFLFGVGFWVGCGSFLADTEPRQFMFRRLGRAWEIWRAGAGRQGGAGRRRAELGGEQRRRKLDLQLSPRSGSPLQEIVRTSRLGGLKPAPVNATLPDIEIV